MPAGGEEIMLQRCAIWIVTTVVMLAAPAFTVRADDAKYPDWQGQWEHANGGGQFDPSKPPGLKQHPPLTPEYQAIWEANLKEQANGGQNYNPQAHCLPGGMPRMMMGLEALEFIVEPKITHVAVTVSTEFRRIYTDGRDWPSTIDPSFAGYSIGKWLDTDGDGRYDTLDVETRGFRGPRQFDSSGIPLHDDNQTIVKERIYVDKNNPNLLLDDVTVIDHAFTHPWTVLKSYRRTARTQPVWIESVCAESNNHVHIGNENYMLSGDGYLMPTKRGQRPPDLKYFATSGK
jgi:hypothetical protein